MYDSSVLENVTAGSKLDVIAPQNGSVKREQRYDGWRSYRRDSPTVSTLFIFIYTGLRFHASPLSLSLPSFFTLFQSILLYMKRTKSMIRNLFIASIPAFVGSA